METGEKEARKRYETWLQSPVFDQDTKRELEMLKGDAAEITDRFYRELEFGTGGLRGLLGAGSNRMNRYIIAIRIRCRHCAYIQIRKLSRNGGLIWMKSN